MGLRRREFLEMTAGAALLPALQGCRSVSKRATGGAARSAVTPEALQQAADAPVLLLDGLDAPLVIESIELLQKGREYLTGPRAWP